MSTLKSRCTTIVRRTTSSLLVMMLVASAGSAVAAPGQDAVATEAELRSVTQQLLDALAPGDRATWDHWLDAAAVQVDENDVVRGKAQILDEIKPLPPGLVGQLRIAEFRIALVGDVAVVTHEDDETLSYFGQLLLSRFRNTDTWHKTAAGWRLLGSQVLAVQKDPPSVQLDSATLCSYAGHYSLTADIVVSARCEDGYLIFERAGRAARRFYPELKDQFFEPGAPRTRRLFLHDASGAITGFVDRREERDILWKRLP